MLESSAHNVRFAAHVDTHVITRGVHPINVVDSDQYCAVMILNGQLPAIAYARPVSRRRPTTNTTTAASTTTTNMAEEGLSLQNLSQYD